MRTIHVLLLSLLLTLGCSEENNYYREGKDRGLQGVPVGACPYGEMHERYQRKQWLRGWADGWVEYRDEKAKTKPVE